MIKAANNRAEEGREIRVKQRHEREEARRQAFNWETSTPGRGLRACKGPEVTLSLECGRRPSRVAGVGQ